MCLTLESAGFGTEPVCHSYKCGCVCDACKSRQEFVRMDPDAAARLGPEVYLEVIRSWGKASTGA